MALTLMQEHAYELIASYRLTVQFMAGLDSWSVGYGLLTIARSEFLHHAVIDAVNRINVSDELRAEATRQGCTDIRVDIKLCKWHQRENCAFCDKTLNSATLL